MTHKTDIEVKTETFYMTVFRDEEFINRKLVDLGFSLANTNWVYSWSVPSWVPEDRKKEINLRLEKSDYRDYLVNVRQETPK